jgi:RNA polymerase sigma factor (sigma-70 family)
VANGLKTVSDEIILKAIDGDVDAFTEIYHTYNQRVFFMAVQYFKNEANAKDIVQEVFIKVHKQICNLKVPKAFNSWLHVITYRECQNYNRRKMQIVNLNEENDIERFPDIEMTSVVDQVENERVKEIIMGTLETMKTPMRTVAVLRFFEELKIYQIAEILDIPESTVKSRLVKIKKVLSDELKNQNVSRNFSIALLSPALIREAYVALSNNYVISEVASDSLLETVLQSSISGETSFLKKVLLGGLTIAVITTGAIMFNQEPENNNKKTIVVEKPSIEVTEKQDEPATLLEITYDEEWTNTSVFLNVETSSDNYDRILVNNEETLQLNSNGDYTIQLIKENEVIDERTIHISNIDKNHPTATGKKSGDNYMISLSDDYSGINGNSISYYRNGIEVNEYQYDQNTETIQVKNDTKSVHELYVSDNAGNILNIKLKVEK